jgi:hypothetical protein
MVCCLHATFLASINGFRINGPFTTQKSVVVTSFEKMDAKVFSCFLTRLLGRCDQGWENTPALMS